MIEKLDKCSSIYIAELSDLPRQKVGPVWLLVLVEVVPFGHKSQYVWFRNIWYVPGRQILHVAVSSS